MALPKSESEKLERMEENFDRVLAGLAEAKPADSVLLKLSNLHGTLLARLSENWPTLPTASRQQIVLRLVEIGEADFEADFAQVFTIGLRDTEPQVRAVSIEGLWEVEDVALIRPLVNMIKQDSSAMVREAAAISLSRFALQAELGHLTDRLADMVWEALWSTLNDKAEDITVRRRSMESLAYFDRPEVDQAIERAYRDDEDMMRISAVFAMGRSANEKWGDRLIDELSRDDPQMRYEAARACGTLRVAGAVPQLSRMVADPDLEVKLAAVWALGQIGGQEAQRVLEVCVEQGDPALQDAADEALEELDFMEGAIDLSLYDFADSDDEDEDEDGWQDEVDGE